MDLQTFRDGGIRNLMVQTTELQVWSRISSHGSKRGWEFSRLWFNPSAIIYKHHSLSLSYLLCYRNNNLDLSHCVN